MPVPQPLKILNPQALDLAETFGISQERVQEISKQLDNLFPKPNEQTKILYPGEVYTIIESICNTHEEFIWALTNHIYWLCRQNRVLNIGDQSLPVLRFAKWLDENISHHMEFVNSSEHAFKTLAIVHQDEYK